MDSYLSVSTPDSSTAVFYQQEFSSYAVCENISSANKVRAMKAPRRELTSEERAECARLKAIFEKRQKEARDQGARMTQETLGNSIGWRSGQSAVNQYLNGKVPLNLEALLKFAAELRFSPGEVSPRLASEIAGLTMTAEKRPAPTTALIASNVQGDPQQVKEGSVPVVGKAMLGPDGYFEATEYPVGHGEGYLNIFSTDENAYGLRVVGHSMKPRIKHNEFVLIEPNKEYVAGDEVLIKTVNGQAMIKEFVYFRDGQYRFDSVNDAFDPIYLVGEEIVSIHYVGAIVKSSRFVEGE